MAKTPDWWQPWMPRPDAPVFRHVDWSRHPKVKKTTDAVLVYVIANADGQHVKIGIARDPEKRLRALQTANHHRLAIIFVSGPYTRKTAEAIERNAHETLAPFRAAGEWFQCTGTAAQDAINRAATEAGAA